MERYWNYLGSQKKYENPIVKVRLDRYHFLPNNIIKDFNVLEFDDWVNIIPITSDGFVVMIRQWRHGVQRECLEIPGGLISHDDPDPRHAAIREMHEETGYHSDSIIHIGSVEPNPAIQTNTCHTFLAPDAHLCTPQDLDPTEAISVELIRKEKVYDMIRSGTITHGLVIAAFAHLMLYEKGSADTGHQAFGA